MKNMLLRYLVAVIAIPLIVLLLVYAPSWMFNLFVTVVMLVVYGEWLGLLRNMKVAAPTFLGLIMCLMLEGGIWGFAVFKDGLFLYLSIVLTILGSAIFGIINQHHDIKQKFLGGGAMMMGMLLCAWGGGSLILVRETTCVPDGRYWILLQFAMTWGGDAGAMHFGKWFGKHKLTPIISPKKTVEGLLGGMLTSIVFGVLLHHLAAFNTPRWHIYLLAPITVLLAHVGDLTASMAKRVAGVKDSSRLIPGHGGFLDRFDNLLLTAPMIYIYIKAFIV